MIHLRSLGQCSIETPTARLGPEAEILFATALYLVLERGRRIPRPAMARLFWPEVSATRSGHCLRQALYKLRSLCVPLSAGRMHVTLAATAVDADYALLFEPQERRAIEGIAERVSGGFLPGYAPAFSEAFSEWLEQQRDTLNSAIRRVLVGEILARKAVGDWRTVDLLARRCIALDPLNEEATLALAESAAMHGSKAEALATLDRYLKEIGPEAREIRLPALTLQRRVSETSSSIGQRPLLQAEFVGRNADISLLNRALSQAQRSKGSAYLIVGEAGMGKTRLLAEFLLSAQLQQVHAVRVCCQSYDERRPLSAFVDLVPHLLSVPGALGCSPDTMGYLKRMERHDSPGPSPSEDARESELLYANIRRALLDVLDAIAGEGCVIIALEDVQWLDATSWKLLCEVVPWVGTRRILLLLTGRDGEAPPRARAADIRPLNHHRLMPIARADGERLVSSVLASAGKNLDAGFVGWCVATACGNPYHLQELALHAVHDGQRFSAPESLRSLIADRLARIPSLSLRVLQASAVLGKYSTLERLEAVLDQPRVDLLEALDALENLGLIDCEGARVQSRHDLLSAEALSAASAASFRLLHRHAAIVLEKEVGRSRSAAALWECAQHWQQAGDTEHAVGFLRSCARHCLELGLPLQAAEILEGTLRFATDASLRADTTSELATCLHLAGQWRRLHDFLHGAAISDVGNLRAQAHTSWELVSVEAKFHCGFDQSALFEHLSSCVRACHAGPTHRVHAATMALMLAENICDIERGLLLYEMVAPCLSSVEVDDTSRMRLALVYHGCFGDQDVAISTARALVDSARQSTNPAWLARTLRNAAEVFKRTGLTGEALEAAHEAYELAAKHELRSAALAAGAFLRNAYFTIGDVKSAKEWQDWTVAHLPDAGDLGFTTAAVFAGGAEVALAEGRLEDAEALLGKAQAAWGPNVHARGQAQLISIRLQIRFAAGCREVSDGELAELHHLFSLAHRLTDHDHLVAVLLMGLLGRGDISSANRIAHDYLRDRRDRDAPAQQLRDALRLLTEREVG